ncbi:Ribosomal protein S18 acetylase RimI [Halolactibacillus halophilus]|uniref:Ribosomal protein S18 acetylase RimI n=1 Tax=Halolactibacillus halophilus TaxID=306540 RepID=A0A1I5MQP9_9BACI|nr:GNAT family N-acetyltransferase [Halolactibacillus halophilus]GEM01230.1 hypothetical protein HHA03_07620 [Halolactibacillus halophilus]SFP11915.1 Ribosomal protein S18 acetylase RimI [Halolactibacillus halophilus]
MISIRRLTMNDFSLYQQMQTGMNNDYMLTVFERLVTPPANYLYGLFDDDILASVAGYTYFPGGNAMLGRLRSDKQFRQLGYSTQLLHYLVDTVKQDPSVKFIGGYTQIDNTPAKKILTKLGMKHIDTYHSFPAVNLKPLITDQILWDEITDYDEKRQALQSLTNRGVASFPYEAYYPFPLTENLIPAEKLRVMRLFKSPLTGHCLFVDNDYKGEALLNIRYVHDDLFTTPGLFFTIDQLLKHEPDRLPWFNFSLTQYQKLTDKDCFRLEPGWELHGTFI